MATDVMGMLTSGVVLALEKARIHDDIIALEARAFMIRISLINVL